MPRTIDFDPPAGTYYYDRYGAQYHTAESMPPTKLLDGSFSLVIPNWTQAWRITQQNYIDLKQWVEDNNVVLANVENQQIYMGVNHAEMGMYEPYASLPYRFYLYDPDDFPTGRRVRRFTLDARICGTCEAEVNPYSPECQECHAFLWCQTDGFTTQTSYASNILCCPTCGTECDDCGEYSRTQSGTCYHCNPHVHCQYCSSLVPEMEIESIGEHVNYCTTCAEMACHDCGGIRHDYEWSEEHICEECELKSVDEDHDESSDMETEKLKIEAIEGRETIRFCGVEIEGANGPDRGMSNAGQFLASALYANELSEWDNVGRYHSGSNRVEHESGMNHFAHVERDSSCDWELVLGPMNVANIEHVKKLNKSVGLVRQMIRDGQAKFDMRCGMHVHVDASKASLASAYNLHVMYMYLEDFLYRIAAAKWPYHRSIPKNGEGAARKSPAKVGKLAFARTFAGDRYYGLSFENYFQQHVGNCRCGAKAYGLFEECTCDLRKCTFEFRLFNTTANTTKIHAYLALCQAMVAKAISLPEIKDVVEYPTLDFIPKKVDDLDNSTVDDLTNAWEQRIEWVATELPLTPEEKQSLYYCVMNSELAKRVSNANVLLTENGGN